MPTGIYFHKPLSIEHKNNISNSLKGNLKVIEAAKKRWLNPNYQKKILLQGENIGNL